MPAFPKTSLKTSGHGWRQCSVVKRLSLPRKHFFADRSDGRDFAAQRQG
jgi:hypothetical protein